MDTRPFLYLQKYSISPKTDLERWDWADLISIVSGETNIFITIFFFFLVPSLNSILFLFHFSLLLIFNDISSNFKESTPSATSMSCRSWKIISLKTNFGRVVSYSRDTAKTFSPKLTPQQESQLRSISFHREKRNAYHEASETLSILYVV